LTSCWVSVLPPWRTPLPRRSTQTARAVPVSETPAWPKKVSSSAARIEDHRVDRGAVAAQLGDVSALIADPDQSAPPAAVGQQEAPQMDGHILPAPTIAAGREGGGALVLAISLVREAGDQHLRREVPPLEEPGRAAVQPRRLAEGDLVEVARQAPEGADDEQRRDRQDGGDRGENPPRVPAALDGRELGAADGRDRSLERGGD
jgi:hypothetical protein